MAIPTIKSASSTVVELITVCVTSTNKSPFILNAPVSSPTAAGSITISAGPLIVLELILIAEPSAPVWKAVAVATPEMLTSSSSLCPSTSRLPLASILPVNVDTPDTFKLSSSL